MYDLHPDITGVPVNAVAAQHESPVRVGILEGHRGRTFVFYENNPVDNYVINHVIRHNSSIVAQLNPGQAILESVLQLD